jgi:hypothetical protein
MLGHPPVILGISDAAYTGLTVWLRLRRLAGALSPEGERRGERGRQTTAIQFASAGSLSAPAAVDFLQAAGGGHIRKRGFGPAGPPPSA